MAKAFWLLGLSPVTDLDRFGLAALVGADIGAAAALAEALYRAHLLQRDESGRWSLHDLLREYSAGCVERELTASERDTAVGRLLDYYLATATAATD